MSERFQPSLFDDSIYRFYISFQEIALENADQMEQLIIYPNVKRPRQWHLQQVGKNKHLLAKWKIQKIQHLVKSQISSFTSLIREELKQPCKVRIIRIFILSKVGTLVLQSYFSISLFPFWVCLHAGLIILLSHYFKTAIHNLFVPSIVAKNLEFEMILYWTIHIQGPSLRPKRKERSHIVSKLKRLKERTLKWSAQDLMITKKCMDLLSLRFNRKSSFLGQLGFIT